MNSFRCFHASQATLKKFRPLFDRVLIERIAAETKSKGGIMLPEKSIGKVLEGKVVACGPGKRDDVSCISPALTGSFFCFDRSFNLDLEREHDTIVCKIGRSRAVTRVWRNQS